MATPANIRIDKQYVKHVVGISDDGAAQSIVDTLEAALCTNSADLAVLIRSSAWGRIMLPGLAVARFELEFGVTMRDSSATVLLEHYKEERMLARDRWRGLKTAADQERDILGSSSAEERKTQFIGFAKGGALTPDEMMLGVYLHYGREEDLAFLAALLVHKRGHERIVAHNWYVLHDASEAQLLMFAPKIQHLLWPLLPLVAEFEVINKEILDSVVMEVQGGGSEVRQRRRPKCFKEGSGLSGGAADTLKVLGVTGGEPLLPVKTDASGNSFVDLADVANEFAVHRGAIEQLYSLANAAKQPRLRQNEGRGRGSTQQRTRSSSANPGRGGSMSPGFTPNYQQGYGRGRGRGGRWLPKGGDEQSQADTGDSTGQAEGKNFQ